MPPKDINSTNEAEFAADRQAYPTFSRTTNQNKWTANRNRDASSIIQRRRIQQTGQGSFNPRGFPLNFGTHGAGANQTTINAAKRRVRSQGTVAPRRTTNFFW